MGISTVNVQANLEATYEPVFIEAPYKAWLLALLVPIGSLSIKFLPSSFERESSKRAYIKGLYISTALSLLIWSVAFALMFNGIGTSEDAEAASDAMANFYMWIHAFAEMLATASLYMKLSQTLETYFPQTQYRNPAYAPQKANVDSAKAAEDAAFEKHLAVMRRYHMHKNQRQAFIHEQEQAFNKDLMRHNDLHHD
ncbi:hypothetical protein EYS14_13470 [Alteromonadaceae bacterium M269]|nr:hypothetical protein EYS14_13470 [Alteromonadaceae bacterium M269]